MNKYHGAWPVLLTPFDEHDRIDIEAYREIAEWYIQKGVGGLFANALSAEMFHLSDKERLTLIRTTVQVASGRVPVVATGSFGENIQAHLDFCRRVADTGVDAVILLVPPFCADEQELTRYYFTIAEQLADVELGIYECPVPRHRLLSPELVGRLAQSGRFGPFKETSCDLDTIRRKVEAARGTPLAVLQANTPYLLEAVRIGTPGMMGLSVNIVPEAVAGAITYARAGNMERARHLHALACEVDLILRAAHPPISKYMLSLRGLPIATRSRSRADPLSPEWRHGIATAMQIILEELP